MVRKSLDTLQVGRAFAAISVVMFHIEATFSLAKYFGRPIFPIMSAGDSGVIYFFVLSGFVISHAHRSDLGKSSNLLRFYWKRFKRIYPPLWIVIIILTPIYHIVPSFGDGHSVGMGVIISAFLASPVAHEYILVPEWTLRHEIIFYFIFSSMIYNFRFGLVVLMSWIFLSVVDLFFSSSFPISFLFSSVNLSFALGVIAAVLIDHFRIWRPALFFFIGSALYLTAWIAVAYHLLPRNGVPFYGFSLGAAIIILSAASIEMRRPVHMPFILVFCGEASYSIYLVHFALVSMMCKILKGFHLTSELSLNAAFILTTFVALTGGFLFHIGIERPVISRFSRINIIVAR